MEQSYTAALQMPLVLILFNLTPVTVTEGLLEMGLLVSPPVIRIVHMVDAGKLLDSGWVPTRVT